MKAKFKGFSSTKSEYFCEDIFVVFFNHFGKRYITNDPSPVEVEMAGYEQQVNQSLIKQVGRKGKEEDVD